MADRISSLEAEKSALEAQVASSGPMSSPGQSSEASKDAPGVAQLRLDLAEALRSKGVAESRLRIADEELTKLREKTKNDTSSLKRLEAECASLTTRLRDREHELREKRKLVEVSPIHAIDNCSVSHILSRRSKMK